MFQKLVLSDEARVVSEEADISEGLDTGAPNTNEVVVAPGISHSGQVGVGDCRQLIVLLLPCGE